MKVTVFKLEGGFSLTRRSFGRGHLEDPRDTDASIGNGEVLVYRGLIVQMGGHSNLTGFIEGNE